VEKVTDRAILHKYWKSIFCVLVICVLLFLPGSRLPKQNLFHIENLDKIVHAFLFLFLEWLLLWDGHVINVAKSVRLVILSTLFVIVFAVLTELIQHFLIPERTGNIFDFCADLIGLAVGIILYGAFFRFINRFFPVRI
jgi:VanZ family protein